MYYDVLRCTTMYYDTSTGETVSREQLFSDYQMLRADDPDNESYQSFETFLHNSMVRFGGSLEKIS